MTRKASIAAALALAIAVVVLVFRPARGAAHPLRDIDGALHGSLERAETELTALFFLGASCPVSRQYAPEIARICSEFKSKSVGCFLVYPEPDLTAEKLKAHLGDFGHQSPAILDPAHTLVQHVGATITPEAAVYSRSGKLLYRGRIDDLYAELGKPRQQAGSHDLRDAIAAAAAGQPIGRPRTEAVGCYIE